MTSDSSASPDRTDRGGQSQPPPYRVRIPREVGRPRAPERASARPSRSPAGPFAGLLMYAAAIWLAADNDTFRRFEARTITPLAGLVTGRHPAVASSSIVYFALGTPRAFGLNITTECTSALLLIPLLVMIGSFATFTRLGVRRECAALAVGAFLMMAVNAVRVAGIAWATWRWGFDPGYKYSHVFVGSAFSLVGFVAAILVALWLLVRGDRPTRTRRRAQPAGPRPASPGPDRSEDAR